MALYGTKDNALQVISQSANTFAPKFYKSVVEDVKGNLICSPISVSMVLSMMAYGARGNTEKQFRTTMALPEDDALAKKGFLALIDSLSNYQSVELHMANKIFVREGIKLKGEFQDMARTGFRSEAKIANFAKSAEASRTINDWCESQTNNRIKDLTKPEELNADAALVLLSAVYFKGVWAKIFKIENTEDRPFYVDGGAASINVPTMFTENLYRYGELPEVKAKFIELPYKSYGGDDISMIIILPDERNGLPELEKNMEKVTMEKLGGDRREVLLYLPKFRIESKIELKDALVRMGMSDMFTKDADFTGIVDNYPLFVDKVIQMAFIEVNELGTEAAAVTNEWTQYDHRD